MSGSGEERVSFTRSVALFFRHVFRTCLKPAAGGPARNRGQTAAWCSHALLVDGPDQCSQGPADHPFPLRQARTFPEHYHACAAVHTQPSRGPGIMTPWPPAATHLRCPSTWPPSAGSRSPAGCPGAARDRSAPAIALSRSEEPAASTRGPTAAVEGFCSDTTYAGALQGVQGRSGFWPARRPHPNCVVATAVGAGQGRKR